MTWNESRTSSVVEDSSYRDQFYLHGDFKRSRTLRRDGGRFQPTRADLTVCFDAPASPSRLSVA